MPVAAILSVDADGLRYQWYRQGGQIRHEEHIAWCGINEIRAFKRDLFTCDLICILLVKEDGASVEVDEEDPNWNRLMDAIPIHLHGAFGWGDWFSDVAFPAFAANERIIYAKVRQAGPDGSGTAAAGG